MTGTHRKAAATVLVLTCALFAWAQRQNLVAEPGGVPEEELWEVLVLMGIGDAKPTVWDGRFQVESGELLAVAGYRFTERDRVTPDGAWRMSTQTVTIAPNSSFAPEAKKFEEARVVPKGLLLRGAGGTATRVTLSPGGNAFTFSPMMLPMGGAQKFLDGRVEVRRVPAATDLSGTEQRQHDFPALAPGGEGELWAVWASYHDRREELNLRVRRKGRWSRLIPVGHASADLWRPQVAAGAAGKPWLVWSQQVEGNWDIYAMARESDEAWGRLHRLTTDPSADIEPHVSAAPDGSIYAVWQSLDSRGSRIMLSRMSAGAWSQPVAVTDGKANDWEPATAVGRDGRVWIAWDRYAGSYDVYVRSYSPDTGLSAEQRVAGSSRFEAHVSIAVDGQGRPWVAWESGGANWGKDLGNGIGRWSGTPLGGRRRIEAACLDGGEWKSPAAFVTDGALSLGAAGESNPMLWFDPAGNLWLSFRRRFSFKAFDRSVYWEWYLTRLEGDRWTDPVPLPQSTGRNSARLAMAASGGRIWAFWTNEDRRFAFGGRPRTQRVVAGSMPVPPAAAGPVLRSYQPAAETAQSPHPDESRDILAVRGHRVRTNGGTLRIVRGDLHRHTEFSQDLGGMGDGSLPEMYRYMIDAAALDFGAATEHLGGAFDYWNFINLKMADMYTAPGRFIALYGYERNPPSPFSHRNIFHLRRDYPIVPMFQRISEKFVLPDTPDGELVTQNSAQYGGINSDDTLLLYDELRKSGGIAIPHTSAGAERWRDNDPNLDPVVEIFQGARGSSEAPGAPAASGSKATFGHVWEAWKKGYRIGVIASSDHFSTHISYAMVYTPSPTREAILNSIRQRRTYGATDNILLEFWLGDRFMGDDFTASQTQTLRVKVRGTAPVSSVQVIRDGAYIHAFQPDRPDAELEHLDLDAGKGEHWYYVRVEQRDGQLAWSSPIWVRYE